MQYDDEKLLTDVQYETMAKAYAKSMRSRGFVFVQLEESSFAPLVEQVFQSLSRLKSCLYALGGRMKTAKIYALNEKQIGAMTTLFGEEYTVKPTVPPRGAESCFYAMLCEENKLLLAMLALAEGCPFSKQVMALVRERLKTFAKVYS